METDFEWIYIDLTQDEEDGEQPAANFDLEADQDTSSGALNDGYAVSNFLARSAIVLALSSNNLFIDLTIL